MNVGDRMKIVATKEHPWAATDTSYFIGTEVEVIQVARGDDPWAKVRLPEGFDWPVRDVYIQPFHLEPVDG